MHCAKLGLMRAQESYIHTSTTQVTAPGLSSAMVQGPEWYSCQPKQLGIGHGSIDNQETSPLGLLFTIFKGREQPDQESAAHGKTSLANEHKRALIMLTSACGVVHTSAWRLGHPARAHEPLRNSCIF